MVNGEWSMKQALLTIHHSPLTTHDSRLTIHENPIKKQELRSAIVTAFPQKPPHFPKKSFCTGLCGLAC
jgi:hypothetical protein